MRWPRPSRLGILPGRAGVAELADARDSKSREAQTSCGFDPHLRHQVSTGFGLSARRLSRRRALIVLKVC